MPVSSFAILIDGIMVVLYQNTGFRVQVANLNPRERTRVRYIIKTRKQRSLGFYMVFLSGLRKIIFSEIPDAFRLFSETGDWKLIDDARKTGYRKAEDYAEKLLLLYGKKKDDDSLLSAIENEFLRGLF